MNSIENYELFFKEKKESEPGSPDSSPKKSNPSNKYLSNFSINKWENIPDELKKLDQWVRRKLRKVMVKNPRCHRGDC